MGKRMQWKWGSTAAHITADWVNATEFGSSASGLNGSRSGHDDALAVIASTIHPMPSSTSIRPTRRGRNRRCQRA